VCGAGATEQQQIWLGRPFWLFTAFLLFMCATVRDLDNRHLLLVHRVDMGTLQRHGAIIQIVALQVAGEPEGVAERALQCGWSLGHGRLFRPCLRQGAGGRGGAG